MSKLKLSGKQIRGIGYPEGPVISLAMSIMEKNFKHLSEEDALEILRAILQSPNEYANDPILGKIGSFLVPKPVTVEVQQADEVLGLQAGNYLGLLSHSGSRALDANIANHYTKIAKEKRKLPGEAMNLAWLDLSEQEGMEYWMAMNLAGDYASACHHIIHEKIANQLGEQPIKMVENHHNFAWKEKHDGKDVIVHRKGATPAGKNVLGIIPGSMTAPGFIVKGKGEIASLSSASHGAGRKMSRTAALKSITHASLKEVLNKHGVKLIGGGLDEAPNAYKDIDVVMQSQLQLVDVVGKFYPKIVKMDGSSPKKWRKDRDEKVVGE